MCDVRKFNPTKYNVTAPLPYKNVKETEVTHHSVTSVSFIYLAYKYSPLLLIKTDLIPFYNKYITRA